ncbi:Uncharacterised protein [Mycobacteroides abscessus subsp. massiliense]|nr:Uncharacterised protein [Mycobacteroides abscessus subsp. massiliense]
MFTHLRHQAGHRSDQPLARTPPTGRGQDRAHLPREQLGDQGAHVGPAPIHRRTADPGTLGNLHQGGAAHPEFGDTRQCGIQDAFGYRIGRGLRVHRLNRHATSCIHPSSHNEPALQLVIVCNTVTHDGVGRLGRSRKTTDSLTTGEGALGLGAWHSRARTRPSRRITRHSHAQLPYRCPTRRARRSARRGACQHRPRRPATAFGR